MQYRDILEDNLIYFSVYHLNMQQTNIQCLIISPYFNENIRNSIFFMKANLCI